MKFDSYLGRTIYENAEDFPLRDVDIIEDDGNAVNIFFKREEFEDEPGKELRTGIILMYDDDRRITHVESVAHIFYAGGGRPEEADPEMCEDEDLIDETIMRITD